MKNAGKMSDHFGCWKWKLEPSEFKLDINESLVQLLPNNPTYNEGYYEIKRDNSAYVCVPRALDIPIYMDLVYPAEWFISIVFLLLSITIQFILPNESYSRPLLIHMIALLAHYCCRIIFVLTTHSYEPVFYNCVMFLSAYTIRAAFCWLTVINYDMWRHLRPQQITLVRYNDQKFWKKFFMAWTTPAIILIASYSAGYCGEKQSENLLRRTSCEMIVYFTCTETILALNILLFVLTMRNLYRFGTIIFVANNGVYKQLCSLYIKLMVTTGLCWIIEALNWALLYSMPLPISVFSEVVTALQGVFLFLVYNCKISVWKKLHDRFCNPTSTCNSQSSQKSQLSQLCHD